MMQVSSKAGAAAGQSSAQGSDWAAGSDLHVVQAASLPAPEGDSEDASGAEESADDDEDSGKKSEGDALSEDSAATGKEDAKGATKTFFTMKNIMVMTAAVAVMASFASVLGDKQKIRENLETAVDIIQKQGDNAMYFYLAFTLIGVVCLVPTTPMEFVGGFLFSPRYGVWMTLLYTSLAKFAANLISVLLARYVIRDWVQENIVSKFELLRLVSTAVRDEPWKMAFLVRGSMLPLSVKNYGLGVLDMPLPPIAVCSCIFTTFYAFQNIYLGSVAGDMKEAFAPKKPSSDPSDWGATVKKTFPMAFNVMLVVFLVRAVKAQIRKTKNQMEEDLKQKSEAASEADMKMGNDKPGRTRESAVSGSAKKAQ